MFSYIASSHLIQGFQLFSPLNARRRKLHSKTLVKLLKKTFHCEFLN